MLWQIPKRIFDLRNLTTLNLTDCRTLTILQARGVSKSKLEGLILQVCAGGRAHALPRPPLQGAPDPPGR